MTKNPHIIIIGAGVAGIAAARRLFDNGYTKLTILEAENRIGGRIFSIKTKDSLFEHGAQWCHGEKDNIVFNLVKKMDLLGDSYNDYANLTFYHSSGKELDKNLTDHMLQIFGGLSYDEDALLKETGSFGDYFTIRYNKEIEKLFSQDKSNRNFALNMLDWFHNLSLCYNAACSWFDMSASGLVQYKECDGNNLLHWKQHGFKIVLDILMKIYPDKSEALPILENIHLQKKVQQILWDNEHPTVECADGSTYSGDHIIFTGSLGVLKEKHQQLFTPELPIYKQNAIKYLEIGIVNKIFLKFSCKWWADDCTGFSFVWSEEDRLNIINEFPYGPREYGKSWLEGILGFYTIDGDSNSLMGWDVGLLTKKVELLPDDIVLKGCQYILNKFLCHQYKIPEPEEIIRTKWYSNENFRGTYSYRSLNSDKFAVSAEDLGRPLSGKDGKLTLFFAGEATHPYYYSTVHGALESGFKEAQRIIELYT